MPTIRLYFPAKSLILMASLISAIMAAGCATPTITTPPVEPEVEIPPPQVPSDWIPIARYGRYTLVEMKPRAAQQNLLLQVVDVSMPSKPDATVGDGLRHVLQRSGYALCDDIQVVTLYEMALPAAHLQLGPMFLHDALLTLAGPAWEMQVDDRERQVCFEPSLEPLP
tara:strand:- start:44742 stop:45245 length:504 start_codon:yes stop_codon:yes gene_type:complete